MDEYVNIKDYFDKYFGNDTSLTIFFFKIIILDLNFLVFFSKKRLMCMIQGYKILLRQIFWGGHYSHYFFIQNNYFGPNLLKMT